MNRGCLPPGRHRATLVTSACVLTLAAVVIAPARRLTAQSPAELARTDVHRLQAAQQVTREFKGGDEHSYEVAVAGDQYLEVVAEQQGINVALALVGPIGQKLIEVDAARGKDGTESLARITETAGTYRIDVRAVAKNAAPGRYRVTLRALRTPLALDRVLEQARRLSEESRSSRAKGAYREALVPAHAALALREQALGADNVLVGDSLHSLALLYDDTAEYAKAEPINLRALTIREKALGPNHPDVASTLNNLAWIASVRHDYTKAEGFYRRALTIQEQAFGPDDPEVATTLNDFALLYDDKGAYEHALELNLRVLSIRERVLGPDSAGFATALNNVALVYENKGEISKAESLYLRALGTWEKALGTDHPQTAFAVDNLARLYTYQGDYARAEALSQRALAIREKALGLDHPDTVTSLSNLSSLYLRIGDAAKAAPLAARSLSASEKKFGPNHPDVAMSVSRLARLFETAGDYAAAEPLYRRALAIREQSLEPGHYRTGVSLNELGQLYLRTGKHDVEAERLFQRSREILEKALGSQHPTLAMPVANLAELYERRGDKTRAAESYQLALTIRETALGPDHADVAISLDRLGRFYQRTGDLPQALALLSRSGEVRERNLTHNLPLGSERQKIGYLELFSNDTANTLSLHSRLAPRDARALRLAFTTLLRRKGRALDAMSENVSALHDRAQPEDRAVFRQLSDERSQLALLTLKGPDRTNAAEYRALVKQREGEVDRLEAEMSRRSLEFRAQSRPITLEAIQSVIPPGTVLVEFALYRPVDVRTTSPSRSRYAAYVLAAEGEPQWADLGEASTIDRAVETWRLALRDPDRADVRRLAHVVDVKLMQPVRALLGTRRHLLISPDGPLNLVPFAALVDERGRYLVERFTITYLSSGRDLLRLQAPRASRGGPVIVADPAFGEPAIAAPGTVDYSQVFFGPLPGVNAEARALKALLPQATVFVKDQATEGAVKQVIGPSILHIATHGFFLQDRETANDTSTATGPPVTPPRDSNRLATRADATRLGRFAAYTDNPLLRSGLALAGANRGASGADDGLLTALEAAGLDLWGTKLVVLSACDTGVGEVRNGDGVYGLRRALVLAGAESQVMSLWPVPDRGTSDLMIGYYKRLMQGDSRGEALRQEQLRVLARQPRAHPYYWAGFILSGQWATFDARR